MLESNPSWSVRLTRPPESGPVTMRVQMPEMGGRRTLEIGQGILTGADRAQAPRSGGQARLRLHRGGGSQRAGHQHGYFPPLEKPLWRDERPRSEAPQGGGEGESPPQK